MTKSRSRSAGAGRSATAEWRRAGAAARRARVITVTLALAALALGLFALVGGDGRVAALAVAIAAAAWWYRPERDVDRWRRGAAGEEATATLLARLPRRWVVCHDCALPGTRTNIDHLAIGPTGVWVVDSKAVRGRLRIRRGQVWAGAYPIDTGPVAWEAEVAARLLDVDVIPLVAVHGGALRRRGAVSGGVRVLPAHRLVRRLRRGRRVLARSDVAALADRAEAVLPPA